MKTDIYTYESRVWDYIKQEYNEVYDQFNDSVVRLNLDSNAINMLRTSIARSIKEHYQMKDNIALTAGTVARIHLFGFVNHTGYANDSFDPMSG